MKCEFNLKISSSFVLATESSAQCHKRLEAPVLDSMDIEHFIIML